jgi:hypothetical protein
MRNEWERGGGQVTPSPLPPPLLIRRAGRRCRSWEAVANDNDHEAVSEPLRHLSLAERYGQIEVDAIDRIAPGGTIETWLEKAIEHDDSCSRWSFHMDIAERLADSMPLSARIVKSRR